jgi:hypothetical protein
MSRVQRRMCLLAVLSFMAVAGCSSESAAPTAPASSEAKSPGGGDWRQSLAALNAGTKPATQTPEEAVKVIVDGLKASKPVALWDAVPEAGRLTLDGIIRSAATQIQPEIWNATVANLKKLSTLLETKKEFILASPLWKSGRQLPKRDQIEASYDPLAKLLKTIVESEMVDQQKMTHFVGHEFLAGTGAKVLADTRALTKTFKSDPLAFIDTMKVTVTKESDSSAKVSILRDPKAKPTQLQLTVVDGQWTSPPLSMGLSLVSITVMGYLEPFRPYQVVEWKAKYLKDMERLGKILDNLQAAKTSADFQEVMGGQVLPFALQKGAQLSRKSAPPTRAQSLAWDRKANTAMVVVKGLHSFEEPTYVELTKSLRAVSPGTMRGPLEVEGSTYFFIGPVDSNFDQTIKAIQVGKIVGQDKSRDSVTVELPTSLKEESSTADAGAKTK